jgi:hypothetical protein
MGSYAPPSNMIKGFDDLDGNEMAAEIADTWTDFGWGVRVTVDANCFPAHSTMISPAQARALAAHLLELADAAEERTADLPGPVPMACTACGKPAEESHVPGTWLHVNGGDFASCPNRGGRMTVRIDA